MLVTSMPTSHPKSVRFQELKPVGRRASAVGNPTHDDSYRKGMYLTFVRNALQEKLKVCRSILKLTHRPTDLCLGKQQKFRPVNRPLQPQPSSG